MIPYPYIGLSHWIALPRQVLSTFNGKGSLPIHELDKVKVQKPYARIRPFPNSSGNVSFTSWRLAHAIKKADLAQCPSFQPLWAGAAGFLLENAQFFDVSPGNKPNIKHRLKDGLEQLDGWDKYITPQPIKSFAIATFLRESRDCSEETSLIAFVDPEPEAPEDPVEFPSDAVRRANYASWLSLMRFDDAANRIRFGAGEPQRRSVPVIALAGRNYAVSILSVSPKQPDLSSREFWDDLRYWPFGCARILKQGLRVELVGLDLEVFKALGSVQGSSISSTLTQLKPQKWLDAAPIESDGCTFYGSIFSDGSLLGELQQNRMRSPIPEFKWREIVL